MSLILFIAGVGAVFMGLAIGASSVSPSFAPVNTNYSNEMQLALVAGVFAFLGAVIQGGNVNSTIGSGILSSEITILQAAVILTVASMLVIISILFDYPMPTAFTVVGAVVGSSFSFGQTVVSDSLARMVFFWILTPPAAIVLSYPLTKLIRKTISRDSRGINTLMFLAGCYVAYTAGAASVGLAVGPLSGLNIQTQYLLLFGATMILLGSWIYSPRIIKAISYDYSNIGPRRSSAALLSSGLIAHTGILLGIPVSFNLVIIPAVVGSGLAQGIENKNSRKIGYTIAAWISGFLLSGLLTFLGGLLCRHLKVI